MLSNLWDALLYKPFLNILAILVAIIPGGDLGIAIIILTLLVKLLIYPLSQKAILSQGRMNLLAPELKKIKNSGASSEEQARQSFDLYRKYQANPFSGCLLILVQLPIIFALYYVFFKGINFDSASLYSFVKVPEHINTMFLGLIDISGKSMVLAILAGLSQYFQAIYMPKTDNSHLEPGSFQESFNKSMSIQMKYFFPFLVAFISYSISGAVALYWTVSNIFAVAQQIRVSKKKDLLLVK